MEVVSFHLQGISPCIMHSERLVNPFDPLTREMKNLTGRRKKTDEDLRSISKIEYVAGLYFDPKIGPYWPAQNIDRMFQDAATRIRRGMDIKRGFMTIEDKVKLLYDGPRTVEELYENPDFVDMRSAVVQRQRVMRCRPIFHEWEVKFSAQFEPDIFNREDLVEIARIAGRLVGLSTYRPRFGRFVVVAVDGKALPDPQKDMKKAA